MDDGDQFPFEIGSQKGVVSIVPHDLGFAYACEFDGVALVDKISAVTEYKGSCTAFDSRSAALVSFMAVRLLQ